MSVLVTLTDPEIFQAAMYGIMRRTKAISRNLSNRHGVTDGDAWRIDIEGCIGEMVVAKMFGLYWNGTVGELTLPDVGKLEVRFTAYPSGSLLVHREDNPHAPFILVRRSRPPFEVAGWCWGEEAQRDEFWTELQPGRPCFAVPSSELRPLEELDQEIVYCE